MEQIPSRLDSPPFMGGSYVSLIVKRWCGVSGAAETVDYFG